LGVAKGVKALRSFPPLLALSLLAAYQELVLPPQVEESGEPGLPVYVVSGAFERITYTPEGRATYILDDAGMAALYLSSDLAVPAIPKVSIFLSNTPDLSQAVKVGELTGTVGPQRWTFRVPLGAVWRWAVLWSEELSVGVARAKLRPQG
jgi:hypothetical protein